MRIPVLGRIQRRWWILFIVTVIACFPNRNPFNGFVLLLVPLTDEFGISVTRVVILQMMQNFGGVLIAPMLGYLTDIKGPRPIFIAAPILAGLGFFLLTVSPNPLLLFISMLIIGASLQRALPIAALVTINRLFARRKGLAMALHFQIFTGVTGVMTAVLLPGLALAALSYGWRTSVLLEGLVYGIVLIPLGSMVRNSPEDTDFSVDVGTGAKYDFRVMEALRAPSFWLLILASSLGLGAISTFNLILIQAAQGEEGWLSIFSPAVFVSGFAVVLALCWLSDRRRKSALAMVGMLSGLLGSFALFGNGPALFAISSLLAGAAGAVTFLSWAILGEFFGRLRFGTLVGMVMIFQFIASTVVAAISFDYSGSQHPMIPVVLFLVSAFLFWKLPTPKPALSRSDASGTSSS